MDIVDWRQKIDELDRRMVELLNERAYAAREIGKLKGNTSMPIYEPHREKMIFENVRKANKGPLPDSDIHHVYERVIEVTRNIQKHEIVAGQEQSQKKSV
jgi:chorismate mutase